MRIAEKCLTPTGVINTAITMNRTSAMLMPIATAISQWNVMAMPV